MIKYLLEFSETLKLLFGEIFSPYRSYRSKHMNSTSAVESLASDPTSFVAKWDDCPIVLDYFSCSYCLLSSLSRPPWGIA